MPENKPLYQAIDEKGNLVLVSSPEDAPASVRDKLVVAVPKGRLEVEPAGPRPPVVAGIHLPSLAIGLAVGALVGGAVFTRRKRPLVRVAVLAAGAVAVAALYLGMVMRVAGLSEAPLVSPTELIDQAKAARDAANAHTQAKERAADTAQRE